MYTLNNGVQIPEIGFGTWQITDKDVCKKVVEEALEIGYRHIDTASIYGNEEFVGEGIKSFLEKSSVKREELFIVTKVWNSDQGYQETIKAFNDSLKRLQLDYVDMYMIHWPQPFDLNKTWETYRALETLYKEKKIKAIGLCNMKEHHLEYILKNFSIVPAVNQIELHPHLQQVELVKFCKENNILIEAWSPLMQGALDHPGLKNLSEKYSKSVAQIVLAWHLQKGILPLPKSVTRSRIEENFNCNFELNHEDMQYIDSLNKEERLGPDPDTINF